MKLFAPLLHFLFHIGYFGPFLMGILDSSLLFFPFGNDLLVVGMVARHHQGLPWYVLSAACGSTVGVYLLAIVARKLGHEGIRRIANESSYQKMKQRIGRRSGLAVALAGLAPPPFPFTTVIAAVAVLDYPLWKTLLINFLARVTRFAFLGFLAIKFGRHVLRIAGTAPFEWCVFAFILLCLVASALSIIHLLRKPQKKPAVSTAGH